MIPMLKFFLYALLLGICLAQPVIAGPIQKLASIELPKGFQYPNGIARARDGTLYVGSVTSGQIVRIDPAGKTETLFPGNNDVFAGTSLRLDEERGILWGTSPDFLGTRDASGEVVRRPHRIFAIDMRSGKVLRVIMMPDRGFGNDTAVDAKGGVYLTDSAHPRIHYLPPGATQLRTWVEDDRLRSTRQPGLAGIALGPDGGLVVNLFMDGTLFKVTTPASGKATIEEITLQRSLENPDGMQFAPDGSLLITEGAVQSGNGRLVRIRLSDPGTQPKPVETLAENLVSPVNLTVAGKEIWVTESRIRHRLLPGQEAHVPDRFHVRRYRLP